MNEESEKNGQHFKSINALISNIHGGSSAILPQNESSDETRSVERSITSLNNLPVLEVDKPIRKHSLFEGGFKIPRFLITGPHSSPVMESSNEDLHRRFSFGQFRRHSHSAVQILIFKNLFEIFKS